MENAKIEAFMQKNGSYFPKDNKDDLKAALAKADDGKLNGLNNSGFRNSTAMTLLAFFFSGFGLDRFMTGSPGVGTLRVLSFISIFVMISLLGMAKYGVGGLIIYALILGIWLWYLIEVFTAPRRTKRYNYKKAMSIIG